MRQVSTALLGTQWRDMDPGLDKIIRYGLHQKSYKFVQIWATPQLVSAIDCVITFV